jgi:hypothetical protein
MRYRFPSLPVPHLAGSHLCIRNGQRSSQISCDNTLYYFALELAAEARTNHMYCGLERTEKGGEEARKHGTYICAKCGIVEC